jgi:hypothetical protein
LAREGSVDTVLGTIKLRNKKISLHSSPPLTHTPTPQTSILSKKKKIEEEKGEGVAIVSYHTIPNQASPVQPIP